MTVFQILRDYREAFLAGLGVTLRLCLIIWSAGLLFGSLLGAASSTWKWSVGIPARFASFTLSGIPILVLLFWLHYPMQAALNVVIDPFVTAATALSLVNIFAVADLVRGILIDFPKEYLVAAKVCGLTGRQRVLEIQLPIVFRQALPGLLILQVNMLQASLFASLISVDEIFRVCQRINSQIYRPVQIYSALAILFLSVCLPLNGLALWLKQKFTRDLSER
jgi:polar amino acid transport system permease protein